MSAPAHTHKHGPCHPTATRLGDSSRVSDYGRPVTVAAVIVNRRLPLFFDGARTIRTETRPADADEDISADAASGSRRPRRNLPPSLFTSLA